MILAIDLAPEYSEEGVIDRMRQIFIIITAFFVSVTSAAKPTPARDWQWWSSRLSLGVEPQADALAHLKKITGLDDKLRSALTSKDRYLAFDVIAALKKRALLEDLITQSEKDETGYFYLAIDSLLEPGDTERVARIFSDRLGQSSTSTPAKIVILDTLARMSFRLPRKQIREFLFNDHEPELRRAALSYLRPYLLDRHDSDDLELLKDLLNKKNEFETLRLQALFLASELDPQQIGSLGRISEVCSTRFPKKILTFCRRLNQGAG